MKPTHLSLFSGIGGLDLAAEAAGFETVGQCEWADFPTKVLEKHWPDVPRWRDIHELTANEFFQKTGISPGALTCISGGFPCQPHSTAGKRKASLDERDLWPEMRRVIGEIRSEWVVAENVRGLLSSENGRFFRGVLRDFANMGYDAGWCLISAANVGAPHLRERLAIIDHLQKNNGNNEEAQKGNNHFKKASLEYRGRIGWDSEPGICRVVNGIPSELDISRNEAIGNAVVPAQFYPIFKAIYDITYNPQG